jgi:hypothetical protein
MYYTIYKTTNLKNGKYYLGMHQTKNLDDGYIGSGKLLRRAIEKYGFDSFKKEILFVFDNSADMYTKERELITEDEIKNPLCYNLAPGGWGGNRIIDKTHKVWSVEHFVMMHEILSEKIKNDPRTKEIFKNNGLRMAAVINNGDYHNPRMTGKTHKDSTKEKMRLSKVGKVNGVDNPSYGTMWITDGINNRKVKKDSIIPEGWRKGRKF